MSTVATIADELRALLGGDRVSDSDANRELHGHGESYHPTAAPDLVVWPTTSEEVAAVVTLCVRHGVPIIPFGAGTSLEGQVSALDGGVSVDLSRMNCILRVSVEDMDVTVEAGVTRLQLEGGLRPQGVFFPVDPGADATIGGMVSTGASGTTTVRYGAMRENVVSLTVVTAAGEIIRTRSRARKSSAGYDLTRLFVGAEGTLGIVTEATLRLHPTPEAMSAAVSAFPGLSEAVECVVQTMQQRLGGRRSSPRSLLTERSPLKEPAPVSTEWGTGRRSSCHSSMARAVCASCARSRIRSIRPGSSTPGKIFVE